MLRQNWLALAGQWNWAIAHRDSATNTAAYSATASIPFPVETTNSGVHRSLSEQQRLWFTRKFDLPGSWRSQRVLLHFEAVDWDTRVWLNGHELGTHRGGYDPFSFDITDALKTEAEQELVLSVYDPTEGGYQAHGKQALHPRDRRDYPACSGIWQTVWLEPVPDTYIERLHTETDIDTGTVTLSVGLQGSTNAIAIEATATDAGSEVARAKAGPVVTLKLSIPKPRLWSPESPFLYDLTVALYRDGRKLDEVSSYFGMRKVSIGRNRQGHPVLMLNNKEYFCLGLLDEGYCPGSLYSAPSDDALRKDIELMKRLGFNACRKHVKVEPDRWYYWCDKLGLLVLQDMPAGDRSARSGQKEINRRPASATQFETELQRIIQSRLDHPSIVAWVPFNPGWGQYDTDRIISSVKSADPSRVVVNPGYAPEFLTGDLISFDNYPGALAPEFDGSRAWIVAGGGYDSAIPEPPRAAAPPLSATNISPSQRTGTASATATNISLSPLAGRGPGRGVPSKPVALRPPIHRALTPDQLADKYKAWAAALQKMRAERALSGAFFTQFTDVESDARGLFTYDRLLKPDSTAIINANKAILGK